MARSSISVHRRNPQSWKTVKKETSKESAKSIQKSRIKRQTVDAYQKKKAKEAAGAAGGTGKKFVDKSSDMAGRIGEYLVEHVLQDPKLLIICGIIGLLLIVVMCTMSSCALFVGGVNNSTIATSCTAENDEILDVDVDYTALEEALQDEVDFIEIDYPSYDEYRYELATIGHNPYHLASLLAVLYEDYTKREVQRELAMLQKPILMM